MNEHMYNLVCIIGLAVLYVGFMVERVFVKRVYNCCIFLQMFFLYV